MGRSWVRLEGEAPAEPKEARQGPRPPIGLSIAGFVALHCIAGGAPFCPRETHAMKATKATKGNASAASSWEERGCVAWPGQKGRGSVPACNEGNERQRIRHSSAPPSPLPNRQELAR